MSSVPARRPPASGREPDPRDLVQADRVGVDVRLELVNLERNLLLEKRQTAAVKARLAGLDALLKRHHLERRRHRDKTFALHRRIMALNAVFDKALARMAKAEEGAWGKVRGALKPHQRRGFDKMMAERRRMERFWSDQRKEEMKGKTPTGKDAV